MKKIKKPCDKEIKKSANEARLDRFIESFPHQIAEDLKHRLLDLKKGATNKKAIMKAMSQQIEQACDNTILQINTINSIR